MGIEGTATTEAPATTSAAAGSTTGGPASTTGAAGSTTGAPASTTGASGSTTGAPASTTGGGASTTAAPPASSTTAPAATTTAASTFRADCIAQLTSDSHQDPTEACDAVIMHNTYRANHNAAPFGIPSAALCEGAQEWADGEAEANENLIPGMG